MYSIMAIDDEIWVLRGLQRQIDGMQGDFLLDRIFTSPVEALSELEHRVADVCFVDIQMPGLDGFHFIERAKKIYPDAIFVIISAYTDFQYSREAIRLRVHDYIVKPISLEALNGLLASLKLRLDELTQSQLELRLHHMIRQENCGMDALLEKMELPLGKTYAAWAHNAMPGNDELFRQTLSGCFGDRVRFFPSEDGRFCLAVSAHEEERSVRDMRQRLTEESGRRGIYIGYGGPAPNPRRLREALDCAIWGSLQYFIDPNAHIGTVKINLPEQLSPETARLIDGASGPKLTSLIMEWSKSMRRERVPVNQAFYQAYSLLSQLSKKGYSQRLNDLMLSLTSPVAMALNFDSLEELAAEIAGCICEGADEEYEGLTADAITAYIDENYTKPLRASAIAEHFFVDAGYMGRLFRKKTGNSIPEYVTALRMDRAGRLLASTQLEIQSIAEAVGYGDYFYFSKVFKKTFGMAPALFRKTKKDK